MQTQIPLFKVHVSDAAIAAATDVLKSGWIGEGPLVPKFEQAFEQHLQVSNAVAVNSGTAALTLAVAVAGIGPGDEVITTAQTMMATSHAILAHQAVPVFADIDYLTGNMAAADIEPRITARTKAILPVHWAGYPCDMDAIHAVAAKHGLVVIEDAAHALGAVYKGTAIGARSDFTCFSFQAIKHITTGDGGMLCVRAPQQYEAARRRRWFGIDRARRQPSVLGEPLWNVTEVGYKCHMNDIAAAMGIEHLHELDAILATRARIAATYRRRLAAVPGVMLLEQQPDRQSANWLFTLHVEKREQFIRALAQRGVAASVVHLRIDRNDVFGGERHDLPELARFTETHVSIPLHTGLSDADVEHVIDSITRGW